MARRADRLPENVPGDLFVDRSCIDCDLCRQLAPATFDRSDGSGMSYVARQPGDDESRRRAMMALVTCPTSSIAAPLGAELLASTTGGAGRGPAWRSALAAARASLPERIAENVYFCGYASEASYGASSYLIVRPPSAGGNVLVDSPRDAGPLRARLGELGGVSLMFLTHRDDVADHAAFRRHFGCERVIHAADARGLGAERLLHGDEPVALADDLLAVPVPGHTRGSTALLYRGERERFLFSGDHLWADEPDGEGLDASRGVCWYDWEAQTRSMERLLAHRFEWVLPGHGRRYHAASAEAMHEALRALIRRMRTRA